VWYHGLDAAAARLLPGGGASMVAAKVLIDMCLFGEALPQYTSSLLISAAT
jgi:hypothetical protein